MKLIQIKSRFGDWQVVSVEKARSFVINTFDRITNLSNADRISYIEKNNLRGTSVVELFGTENRGEWRI